MRKQIGPEVPLASSKAPIEFVNRYEQRPITGDLPAVWDGSGHSSLTQMWMRDAPPRPLDFASLTAIADIFYPRIYIRRATHVPAGTVSMTVYFHASAALLRGNTPPCSRCTTCCAWAATLARQA